MGLTFTLTLTFMVERENNIYHEIHYTTHEAIGNGGLRVRLSIYAGGMC